MNKLGLLATSAAVALSFVTPVHAVTYIGNVCGVPVWHHAGVSKFVFQVNPSTTLPPPLTKGSFYGISEGALDPNNPVPSLPIYGNIVRAVDVEILEALKQPMCFDVTTATISVDDTNKAYLVYDHDVPSE